jgi:hypothetical protein
MISEQEFTASLVSASEMLPMMRQLSPITLATIYIQLPKKVINEMSLIVLQYAIKQRMMDPFPPDNIALHMQLFRYVYPVQDNVAVLSRQLREDLKERMSNPDVFHDVSPKRNEFMTPNHGEHILAPSAYWHPNKMSTEQWRKHFKTLGLQISMISEEDKEPMTIEQLLDGKWLYKRSLAGFWLLNIDTGKIATNWILRNKNLAQEMLVEAINAKIGAEEIVVTEGDEVPW